MIIDPNAFDASKSTNVSTHQMRSDDPKHCTLAWPKAELTQRPVEFDFFEVQFGYLAVSFISLQL